MSRFLATYQAFVSKATDAPAEFGHAGGLACLSTIALGRRWIARGQDGIKPNIFLMLVAGSSRDRKSTSVKMATSLLRDVEHERVGPTNFTAEGLLVQMAKKNEKDEQRNKMLVPMSEFGEYLSSAATYGTTTASTLCALYDGEDYDRVRAGGAPIYIAKPRLSILAAVAYGMLEKYGDARDWNTGFFNRFLFVAPNPEIPRTRYDAEPVFPAAEADYARAALADLQRSLEETKGPMGISKAGEEIYRGFSKTIPADSEDPVLSAQRERLLNAVWKLSMLYQVDLDPHMPISELAVTRACDFAQMSWAAFKLVYSKTAADDFSRLLRRVIEFVAAHPEGTTRRVILHQFHLNAARLLPVLEFGLKMGAIRSQVIPTATKPREVLTAGRLISEE